MAYRGRLYFTTNSASYDYRVDLYAGERRCLPNRTHGIRYSSSPKRGAGIKTYVPCNTVRPARATLYEKTKPSFRGSDIKNLITSLLVVVVFIGVCAGVGVLTTQGIVGLVKGESVPSANADERDNAPRAESTSDPPSSWKQGRVPALYQSDPQWAKRPYGSGTMGSDGSAALCLAMVRIATTGDTSMGPIDIASYAQQSNFATPARVKELLGEGASGVGLVAHTVEASETAIRSELMAGRPIIAFVQANSPNVSDTFIVLTNVDERGKLIVNDPAGRERSRQRWNFDEITSSADGLWSYTTAN